MEDLHGYRSSPTTACLSFREAIPPLSSSDAFEKRLADRSLVVGMKRWTIHRVCSQSRTKIGPEKDERMEHETEA
eukprot:scaffold1251_cov333-Pavlova_lutheri.AAC.7